MPRNRRQEVQAPRPNPKPETPRMRWPSHFGVQIMAMVQLQPAKKNQSIIMWATSLAGCGVRVFILIALHHHLSVRRRCVRDRFSTLLVSPPSPSKRVTSGVVPSGHRGPPSARGTNHVLQGRRGCRRREDKRKVTSEGGLLRRDTRSGRSGVECSWREPANEAPSVATQRPIMLGRSPSPPPHVPRPILVRTPK